MSTTSRLYHCTRCHCQVIICRRCDRGNVYCGETCANPARSESKKRAAKRYQCSRLGRQANADRQSRFREKHRLEVKKVTHQGSRPTPPNDLLSFALNQRQDNQKTVSFPVRGPIHCHFCQCECSFFLRSGFIRQSARRFSQN